MEIAPEEAEDIARMMYSYNLSKLEAVAWYMHVQKGMSSSEIARDMGVSRPLISNRLKVVKGKVMI